MLYNLYLIYLFHTFTFIYLPENIINAVVFSYERLLNDQYPVDNQKLAPYN